MSTFKIAHIREQGIDLIIVPLDPGFDHKPRTAQQEVLSGLQACANAAGLAGTVIPVWQHGGNMRFIAPTKWHPFFKGLSWMQVLASLNKELTCN